MPALLALVPLACGPAAPPASPAAAAPVKAATNAPIRPALHLGPEAAPIEEGKGGYKFEVVIAQIPEANLGQAGLSGFFASAAPANDMMEAARARSEVVQFAHLTNVIVKASTNECYAGTAAAVDAQALLKKLKTMTGVDVLTAPRVSTRAGRKAAVMVQDSQTVAMSFVPNTNGSFHVIAFGQNTLLRAAPSGNRTRLEAAVTLDEFGGYVRPAKQVRHMGEKKVLPEPIFGLATAGIRTELGTNEVLILGTGVREQRVEITERIPWLGALPVLGDRIFTRHRVQTNRVRQVIFVTPQPL